MRRREQVGHGGGEGGREGEGEGGWEGGRKGGEGEREGVGSEWGREGVSGGRGVGREVEVEEGAIGDLTELGYFSPSVSRPAAMTCMLLFSIMFGTSQTDRLTFFVYLASKPFTCNTIT